MPTTVVNANTGIANNAALLGNGLGGVRYEEIPIGIGTTAPAATQTALVSEIVSGGGERKTGASVSISLVTDSVTNDTILFNTAWGFLASFAVCEFAVCTNEAGPGTMWFRGRFETSGGAAAPINVQSGDTLEAFIYVKATDESADAFKRIPTAGLEEMNRLLVEDVSPSGTRISDIALGEDNGTLLPLAASNTGLGDEFVIADGKGLARSQKISGPTVSLATVNVPNDTTVVTEQWEVVADNSQVDVKEMMLTNSPTQLTGKCFFRHLFTNGTLTLFGKNTAFSLSRGGRLTMIARLTNK
jgi:hypothetical protein